MRRVIIAAIALLIGVGLYGDLTWRKRRYERELRKRVSSIDHYLDIGVELRTVVADPNGEQLIPDAPRMRIVRTKRAGGILDTELGRLVAPSRSRKVWYCSEDQEPIILHAPTLPLGIQVVASEGAGKTTILPQWHYFRWLEHLGKDKEGGQSAPTRRRLAAFLVEFHRHFPRDWYWYIKSEGLIVLADGTRLRLVSTHQQSKEEGSPLQMYTWAWSSADEMQDQIARHSDMQMRGRGAIAGRYKQARMMSPKDSPSYRTYRDTLATNPDWTIIRLLGTRSPFVPAEHWEKQTRALSKREYDRRVLALDVGPERQQYHTWKRGEPPLFDGNVRPVPVGAQDVTAEVLRPWGANLQLLVGHDPGRLFDVSVMLKAYRFRLTAEETRRRQRLDVPLHDWWIVDEVTTQQSTTDQHVTAVLARVRDHWGVHRQTWNGMHNPTGAQMLVRADPYSDSGGGEGQPDRSVYTTWRQRNITILPAAYRASTNGQKVGRVPKEGRIEMVCRLLCDASGVRRLYVACNERREVAAPKTVESFEVMERDEVGRAEAQRKDLRDMSHWTAACGYALWTLEKPRIGSEPT